MDDVIDRMFADGRLVNLKVFTVGRPSAQALVDQIVSAERQIADGTATRVMDVDNYTPPSRG
jgi:hypothetical protein